MNSDTSTASASSGEAVISVRDLRKTFLTGFTQRKKVEALVGVSLDVIRGGSHGFLGPNGAGKTTTIKVLTGLIHATSGEAKLFGGSPQVYQSRKRLGFLPENPVFPDHLTGGEVLLHYGRLAGAAEATLPKRIDELLELVKLTRAKKMYVRNYSKGMTQRLGIAQSMLHDPELLIWDEPMSGLDPIGRHQVKELMIQLRGAGKTLFFSSHIIADIEEICDDVSIVVNGKVTVSGPVSKLVSGVSREVEVRVNKLVPAQVAQMGGKVRVDGTAIIPVPSSAGVKTVLEQLWSMGGEVIAVTTVRHALEDVFLSEVNRNAAPNQVFEG